MHIYSKAVVLMAAVAMLLSADSANANRRNYTLQGLKPPQKEAPAKPPAADAEKPFADLIKDKVAIPGLFTFYRDTLTGSVYLAIRPAQFDQVYLMSNTISRGDGTFSSNAAMHESLPFFFKRVNKKVLLMEKNLLFRADSTTAFAKAIPNGVSDHIWGSAKIESKPQDSTGAILIDVGAIFIRDAENLGYFSGQLAQSGVSLDRDNSYLEKVKSFPENSEIDARLHYRSTKPLGGISLANPYSFFHTYHFSLSTLPKTDYVPRLADDRVGAFQTIYQDYTSDTTETSYVRFVNRWNLKKKDPSAAMSEPVEPIVFWIENTVPQEYRAVVAEGIELWNKSFEKIGFKNAVVAKQMPDTATWEPADVRYNTIRWILEPGQSYAAGPSRANPYTGQIYDADIRVSADFMRYISGNSREFVAPVSYDGRLINTTDATTSGDHHTNSDEYCTYQEESAEEAASGLIFALANAPTGVDKEELRAKYVHDYIRQLICHEVGHTLGLRHNFKASTIYSLEQISDTTFTRDHSTGGSMMDYAAPNIAGRGTVQGDFYDPKPGPYDDWAIAYMYSDFSGKTPQEDLPKLQEIASRAADPLLVYGTDEDGMSGSVRSIDPRCVVFDLGNDVIKFCIHKIELTRDLWLNSLKDFEKPGVGYPKLRRVFQTAWRSYIEASTHAGRCIGGIYASRNHIGDPGGKPPYEVVPAAEQRRAMAFFRDYLFAPDVFKLPEELLNKLAADRNADYEGSVYSTQLDYPIYQTALRMQTAVLDRLYSPVILARLQNNELKFKPGEDKYLMVDMFGDMRKALWGEATSAKPVNGFRRQIQLVHLAKLIDIYLSNPAMYPSDARTLAANDLNIIESAATRAAAAPGMDEMSQAHFKEVVRQIQAAQKAQRQFSPSANG